MTRRARGATQDGDSSILLLQRSITTSAPLGPGPQLPIELVLGHRSIGLEMDEVLRPSRSGRASPGVGPAPTSGPQVGDGRPAPPPIRGSRPFSPARPAGARGSIGLRRGAPPPRQTLLLDLRPCPGAGNHIRPCSRGIIDSGRGPFGPPGPVRRPPADGASCIQETRGRQLSGGRARRAVSRHDQEPLEEQGAVRLFPSRSMSTPGPRSSPR